MLKTPSSTVIGGAGIWTPGCTVIGGQQNIHQLIKSLFSDGTQGIYLNAQDALSVSDLSSIKDLSGRNNHATQANATSRASLITDPSGYKSLKFDGIDDGYVTQSIDFSNTDKVTVIAAVRKLSDVNIGIVAELGVVATSVRFTMQAPPTAGQKSYLMGVNFGSLQSATTATNYASPTSNVLTTRADRLSKRLNLRIDGFSYLDAIREMGADKIGDHPLYIGRRGGTTLPFNGQIYALLVIGKLLDDATTQRIEKEFAKYIGVTL